MAITRRRLWFVCIGAIPTIAGFVACGGADREDLPRYYFPPDAAEEDATPAVDAPSFEASEGGEAGLDASDAGPTLVRALATGSGEHPDALVGSGDHTCVIAGPTRSLYCWGANDYGQI